MENAAENLVQMGKQPGLQALVSNLEAELLTMEAGGWTLPVSRNDGQRRTCYLNSPSRAFLEYGAEELDRLTTNPLARFAGRGVLTGLAPLISVAGMDRQIQLNNWMVATNILPPLSAEDWLALFAQAGEQNPGFVPLLRSVNKQVHSGLLKEFAQAGLTLFPMRKVFVRDYARDQRWTTDEAKDAKLLTDGAFEQRSGSRFSDEDFEQAAALYAKLYLEKYSALNPHYSALFLQLAQARLGLNLEGLFDAKGRMVGVIGRFEQHGTLTGPVVGYDTALPAKRGLYRRLRAINHGFARRGALVYNMSAGAERFKRLRGGQAGLEFMVADFRQAKPAQRRAANALSGLCRWAASRMPL